MFVCNTLGGALAGAGGPSRPKGLRPPGAGGVAAVGEPFHAGLEAPVRKGTR
jgi:hypothetical protein